MLNLPQILKASEPEKKKPVTPKHQNGDVAKKATEKSSKKNSKDNAGPSHTDTEKKVKHNTAPNSGLPKETLKNAKVSAAPESRQSAAPKRKGSSAKSNSSQAAKKQKSVVEETKPTEYVCISIISFHV